MITMKFRRALWCALLSLVVAAGARAEMVTMEFTGSVSAFHDPLGAYGSLVRGGDAVRVSLRYDTTAADSYANDPTRGNYMSPGWLRFEVNGLAFQKSDFTQIDVLHYSDGKELFQVLARPYSSEWGTPVPGGHVTEMMFAYWQWVPPFTMLVDDSLPLAVDFSVADGSTSFVRMSSAEGIPDFEIMFNLVQVPEPGTWVLLTTALSAAAVLGRRRVRRG